MKSRNNLTRIGATLILVFLCNALFAQYGNGSSGAATFSSATNLSLTKTNVSAISGTALTVISSAGFAANNEILLIQMTGSSGNQGNWEQTKITSVSGSTITLAALTKTYDAASEKVQLIKLEQYSNLNVSGTVTTDAWNGNTGGVLAVMVQNEIGRAHV